LQIPTRRQDAMKWLAIAAKKNVRALDLLLLLERQANMGQTRALPVRHEPPPVRISLPDKEGDFEAAFSLDESGKYCDGNFKMSSKCSWRRPREFCSTATLFPPDNCDWTSTIQQGSVGNCWFIAGLIAVCLRDTALIKALFLQSDFERGLYQIVFHHRGTNYSVFVDDRLPVELHNNSDWRLLYAQAPGGVFCWAILEKAFAKLNMSATADDPYTLLDGGTPIESMAALTGAPSTMFELGDFLANGRSANEADFATARLLRYAHERLPLVCSFAENNKLGLLANHAYVISGCTNAQVTLRDPNRQSATRTVSLTDWFYNFGQLTVFCLFRHKKCFSGRFIKDPKSAVHPSNKRYFVTEGNHVIVLKNENAQLIVLNLTQHLAGERSNEGFFDLSIFVRSRVNQAALNFRRFKNGRDAVQMDDLYSGTYIITGLGELALERDVPTDSTAF
jgi:hypothetical protein